MLCNRIVLLCGQHSWPFHLIVSVFPEVYLGHDGLQGGLGCGRGWPPGSFSTFSGLSKT